MATSGKPFGGICIAAEYIKAGGKASYDIFKNQLIDEINALKVLSLPRILY